MKKKEGTADDAVNCRIGSLEMRRRLSCHKPHVNCRIGSLENKAIVFRVAPTVNCRIGSLESGIKRV